MMFELVIEPPLVLDSLEDAGDDLDDTIVVRFVAPLDQVVLILNDLLVVGGLLGILVGDLVYGALCFLDVTLEFL